MIRNERIEGLGKAQNIVSTFNASTSFLSSHSLIYHQPGDRVEGAPFITYRICESL